MIIKIDNLNHEQYELLFKNAYEMLVEKEVIAPTKEKERFTSLEEFFSHIQEIYQADPSFLIKLPVDEPTLTIDANKRTVDTTLFNKTATVQSDQVAEIAIFSIDRYYDYMDLSTAEIWVQWTAPGIDGPREGATLIELRDIETEPGKVRFGWPLDSDITAIPGNVQFAVRFFKRGNVTTQDKDGNLVTENKIVYSLNTLPAMLKVSNALQPELNNETEINRPQGLFTHSIVNSIYTGKDVVLPQTPSFENPGLNLPGEATLIEDDANGHLTLKAQAFVGDTGSISYKWYYTPVGSKEPTEILDPDHLLIKDLYVPIDGEVKVLNERYYVHMGGETYSEYLGSFPVADDVQLYEKYTTYTFPATGDVTGTYEVRAINSITVNDNNVNGLEQKSRPCTLVSPSEIVIKEDLPLIAVMKILEGSEDPANTTLKIMVEKAEKDNSVYTYEWLKAETVDGELKTVTVNDGDANNNIFIAKQPGWYNVKIYSSLNRQVNTLKSDINTKVTFMPEAPSIGYDTSIFEPTNVSNRVKTDESPAFDSDVELTVTPTVVNASTYNVNDLYSEGFTYQWYIAESDKDIRPILSNELVAGDPNTASITVKRTEENENCEYICYVTNHLNNQTNTSDLTFIIV